MSHVLPNFKSISNKINANWIKRNLDASSRIRTLECRILLKVILRWQTVLEMVNPGRATMLWTFMSVSNKMYIVCQKRLLLWWSLNQLPLLDLKSLTTGPRNDSLTYCCQRLFFIIYERYTLITTHDVHLQNHVVTFEQTSVN